MPISINDTTWKETPKLDPKDRIEVEIGDSKQEDFYPQVKVMRWDNEVNFSARLVTEETAKTASVDTGVIKWLGDTTEAHFYPITEGEGGYEFEVILKEKPKTNVVSFTLNTKELDYFYTPIEYDEEEIKEGAFREENVKGSYAVYHKTKSGDYSGLGKMNYRAGKFGHIYRPKVTDSNGKEIWGVLSIENDLLNITIDQKFLDDAKYPVVVDPTLGYTTIGGTSVAWATDTIRTNTYTTTEAGNVYYIVVWSGANGSQTDYMRGVVYLNSDLSRITYGAEVSWNQLSSIKWRHLPVTRTLLSTSTAYRIGVWIEASDVNGLIMNYDAGLTSYRDNYAYHATNAPVNPLVDDASTADRKLSLYALYSVTSGTGTDTFSGAGTHTWVAPTGVTSVNVECWGGGAGGETSTSSDGAGAGGGGAYAATNGIAVTAGNSYTVVVGAGGETDTSGGDSTWETNVVVADGGSAGSGATGGAGGTTANSTGDTEYAGGSGGDMTGGNNGGAGGGGGAGKDGIGLDGADSGATTGGTGGAGDNGSGGAGGTSGVAGVSNVLGGGGGGGGAQLGAGARGGVPGGGGGGGGLGTRFGGVGGDGAVSITYTIAAGGGSSETGRKLNMAIHYNNPAIA